MRLGDWCTYRHNSVWFQIRNGKYREHLPYTRKSQNGHQQNYDVVWGFLEDSDSPSTEKDTVHELKIVLSVYTMECNYIIP